LLHRDDLYDPQNRSGEADLNVAKHRNGPTKIIPIASLLHFAKFADMAPKYTAPQEKFVKDN
jgi:replicative DNA helicase